MVFKRGRSALRIFPLQAPPECQESLELVHVILDNLGYARRDYYTNNPLTIAGRLLLKMPPIAKEINDSGAESSVQINLDYK